MSVKIPSFFTNIPYPNGSSLMSSRDHPFNKSTRPLLMERKTQYQIKKKTTNVTATVNRTALKSPVTNSLDSDDDDSDDANKKLHGFNDFDVMSQQYKNFNRKHIGYPYSSPPPSPPPSRQPLQLPENTLIHTTNSSDFIFSDNRTTSSNFFAKNSSTPNTTTITPTTKSFQQSTDDDNNYYSSIFDFNQKIKNQFNHNFQPTTTTTTTNVFNQSNSGPFIFGIHSNPTTVMTATHPTLTTDKINTTVINSTNRNYIKPLIINQSNSSDTSSSSKDCEKESKKCLVKCRKKSTKRNNKEKKNFIKKNLPSIKCVVVGDGTVGKTNLILSYLENRFIFEHIPTASDIYNAEVMVNESPVHVTLCDTAGQDTLDPLRELCYPDCNVFLLCFSVVKPETFHSIKTKWAPKFSKSKAALILVGTQADLRSDTNVLRKLQNQKEKTISFADAWDLATSIGAKYIETSSFTQERVKDVFDAAIWEALAPTELPPRPPLWKRIFCLA